MDAEARRAVSAAGAARSPGRLDGLTPHGLRHTAASLYIAPGTPPKVVQRILGHRSIAITLDLYGHLYPDEMDTWATRLGEIATRACDQNVTRTGADRGSERHEDSGAGS